ncbi:hypothetical protein [Cellvibrio sp. QJXJ]|uniref:hypothetical protein n=1 Tax=Cellvibrio sp. QJXJ TaxID=2964606 RepID=UPI0021C47F9F|nr:hypothetical protein [Cellvibrio sp. QJXJ]UUA75255.1 hypothetical protein NNX04_22635 [Cellvibrio sp. QJXJ]
MKSNNVVPFKKPNTRTDETVRDMWYSPYEMPNGNIVYGAAAMNARVKQAGGLQQLLNTYAEGFFNQYSNISKKA